MEKSSVNDVAKSAAGSITLKTSAAKLALVALLAVFFPPASSRNVWAQATAPSLGTAQSFAILGGSTVTNTGPTVITGNLGVSPGTAVTGFPPGTVVGGTIHAADAVAAGAQADTTTAYNDLASEACGSSPATELAGQTLVPGVYCFTSSASLNGTLTLDGQNNPNAVWVFKIGSTLITGSAASVILINGAQSCDVFWQVGSSATLGTGTNFVGNILALASITLTTDAIVSGRALAQNGAVTLDSNQVAVSTCSVTVPPIPPTVGKAFSPATVDTGVSSTLTITLTNADPTNEATAAGFTDTLPSGLVAVAGSATTTCGGTASNTASSVTLAGGTIPAAGSCAVTVEVTAAEAGSYINSLAAGALSTSNGSNVAPAVATLTVNIPVTAPIPPTVSKAFNQATINAGTDSVLTITLSNADSADATGATLTDTLPSGVVVANPSSASNSCGGTFAPSAGDSAVTLTGGTIPATSFCVLTVEVTAASANSYFNVIAAGALVTINGSNAAPAIATLTVITPTTGAVPPTISKAFNLATITAGGTSTLTITLSNSGTA